MKHRRSFTSSVGCTLGLALFSAWSFSLAFATPASGAAVAVAAAPANQVSIKPSLHSSSGASGSQTITLAMPPGTQSGTLKAVLNGKDVSSRFSETNCGGKTGVCATGTLSSSDGMRDGKNVLYVVAKGVGTQMVSSRLRFTGTDTQAAGSSLVSGRSLTVKAIPSSLVVSDFLPPSISFTTLSPGGYSEGNPWIQIGAQTYPTDTSLNCNSTNGQYLVIVLDRQTLVQKTDAPESSPYCATSSINLNQYLEGLSSSDLVIVGTLSQRIADNQFDTSPIGGTSYIPITVPIEPPQGYLAIGTGGAPAGQAYENYNTASEAPTTSISLPSATGMLVEDLNGNYNFQSSDALEYTVSPNDPSYPGQSIATVWNSQSQKNSTGLTGNIYTSGPQTIGGYYLLILQRENLQPSASCTQTSTSGSFAVFQGCGAFFPTGDPNNAGANATTAYLNLAQALNGLKRNQLAVLTTVGDAAFANSSTPEYQVASTAASPNGPFAYYGTNGQDGFSQALFNLGAPDFDTMYLYHQANGPQTFTYITAPKMGNPLSGKSILSTSLYSQQGETGYVHGLFVKDINGLYRPGHTSQETVGADSANFVIGAVSSQQPIEWPETSNALLSGADTVAGQQNAYAYLSWYLLQFYIQGLQGPHQYDIHYFFTGSLNTMIDYHSLSPIAAQWPGSPNFSGYFNIPCQSVTNNVCTWISPDGSVTLQFSQNDFLAVARQLNAEVIYLTNTLQFMVNGSVNMKDVVASGASSTALALVGAAATVQGSTLQPPPATPVKADVGNIIDMVGAALNIVGTIGTGGLVPPDVVSTVNTTVTVVGDLLEQASTIGGGFTTSGASINLPSSDYTFETTIGELANSDLQGQMSAGFDAMLDVILSDWSKLSQIGPLVTDTTNQGFYAPVQTTQNIVIDLLNQGTQRSLYLSLVPIKYQIQFWPTVYSGLTSGDGGNEPDMGWWQSHVDSPAECHQFYPVGQPYDWIWAPSSRGSGQVFSQNWSDPSIDFYVMAAPFSNAGSSSATAQYPDTQLMNTLFSNQSGGLNLPSHIFFSRSGPMANPPVGDQAFIDASKTDGHGHNLSGYSLNSICSWQQNQDTNGVGAAPGTPSSQPVITTTTLSAPSSAILGQSVQLQSTVTAASGAIPVGNVQFRDGATVLGTAALDATGSATFTATGLALGDHLLAAYYITQGENNASSSVLSTLTVYAAAPDIALSLSASSLSVSYGSPSSAVTVQATSQSGLAGTVSFSCTGLPVGMTCNFNPAQTNIVAGASVSTSFTISSGAVQTAGLSLQRGIGILLLPLSLLCLLRIRAGRHCIQKMLCLLLLSALSFGCLVGCSGSGNPQSQQPLQETGSKTILVNASSGSYTKTIPLVLNIQ